VETRQNREGRAALSALHDADRAAQREPPVRSSAVYSVFCRQLFGYIYANRNLTQKPERKGNRLPVIDLTRYRTIIFDKDGTLLDFNAMWGGWVVGLASRLEAATGLSLADDLFRAFEYDAAAQSVVAGGRMALTPMTEMRLYTGEFLRARGLPPERAQAALAEAWHAPDPVVLARPLFDLASLFGNLKALGLKVAVATSDDRGSTLATLAAHGAAHLVDVVICADDGIPIKPEPHMVWEAARATGCQPAECVMVGDAVVDLQMARAAGCLGVGVLSGLATAEQLRPWADVLLNNVAELITSRDTHALSVNGPVA
jgi:phosphoglycolate phosphatase